MKLILKIWRKKKKIRKIKEMLSKLIEIMGSFLYGLIKMGILLCIKFVIIVSKIGLAMLALIKELVKLLFRFNFIGMLPNCTQI